MNAAKSARTTTEAGAAGPSSRERILKEAERVFGALGFDGASMRQVAEAAGVPPALVSYHFGSKEGFIAQCSTGVCRRWWSSVWPVSRSR